MSQQESEPYKKQFSQIVERVGVVSTSRLAGEIFTKASGEFQALAIAQATRVQQLSRATGIEASVLMSELLADAEELERVVTLANNAHREAIKNAPGFHHIPAEITVENTVRVIQPVFAFAILLEDFSSEKLDHILGVFHAEYLVNREIKGRSAAEKIFTRQVMDYLTLSLNTIHLLQLVGTNSSTDQSPKG